MSMSNRCVSSCLFVGEISTVGHETKGRARVGDKRSTTCIMDVELMHPNESLSLLLQHENNRSYRHKNIYYRIIIQKVQFINRNNPDMAMTMSKNNRQNILK